MKDCRESMERALKVCFAWGKPPCQVGGRCASSRLRLTAVCSFGQEFFCRQASAVPAWGKLPCQAGCRCAASHLRLTAVCPFGQEFFCRQASAVPAWGKTAMPSGRSLRVLPLAADRRMSIQPGTLLQASLRQSSRPNGRMAVFETKFDKSLCRLAWKRYNCLVRQINLQMNAGFSWRRYVKRYFN